MNARGRTVTGAHLAQQPRLLGGLVLGAVLEQQLEHGLGQVLVRRLCEAVQRRGDLCSGQQPHTLLRPPPSLRTPGPDHHYNMPSHALSHILHQHWDVIPSIIPFRHACRRSQRLYGSNCAKPWLAILLGLAGTGDGISMMTGHTLSRWLSTRRCRCIRTYLGHFTNLCRSCFGLGTPPTPAKAVHGLYKCVITASSPRWHPDAMLQLQGYDWRLPAHQRSLAASRRVG